MAGVSLSVTVDDAPVREALAALAAAGADLTPAMEAIGSYLEAETLRRFETETGPDGNPWPPSIRALAEGGQTLTDRAHLRNSITHQASATGVEVGTNVIYAAVHQVGGTIRFARRPPVTMPERPFLGIGQDDPAEILAILRDHLEGSLR